MLINFERQVPHIKKKLWAIYLKNQLQNLVNQYFKSQGSNLEKEVIKIARVKNIFRCSFYLILHWHCSHKKAKGWPSRQKSEMWSAEKQKIEKRSRLSSNFRLLTQQASSEKDKLTNESHVSRCWFGKEHFLIWSVLSIGGWVVTRGLWPLLVK